MTEFVGLDVSQELTHICIVNSDGDITWQGKCYSQPDTIADAIKKRTDKVVRIGLESGPLSTWLWHTFKGMGLPVVCLDARHAKAALSMQVNKTDKNDALGLAQIVRTGWYREVGVKSLDSHTVRAVLGARAQLVGMRTEIKNQMRGILKTFGVVVGRVSGQSFERRIEELASGDGMLNETLRSLLAVLRELKIRVAQLDGKIREFAKENAVCRHLMTVPGVGILTAVAFVTAVDDPAKFGKSQSVGAYFGLTPRRYQSGEVDQNGRISKCGDPLVRSYLYEAAMSLLTRVQQWSSLKAWGLRIARRSGMKKAIIAVARKLAVVMHRMWVSGEAFRWSDSDSTTAPA